MQYSLSIYDATTYSYQFTCSLATTCVLWCAMIRLSDDPISNRSVVIKQQTKQNRNNKNKVFQRVCSKEHLREFGSLPAHGDIIHDCRLRIL